jgi:predicted RNase H-like HicB family nuclease
METTILNYRIIIEKEEQKKGFLYVAHVPSLGISDFGKTVEEASINVKKAIQLYIETLIELKKQIPTPDNDDYFVTSKKIEVNLPANSFVY